MYHFYFRKSREYYPRSRGIAIKDPCSFETRSRVTLSHKESVVIGRLRFRRVADCKCTRDRREPAGAPQRRGGEEEDPKHCRCSRRFRGTFTLPGFYALVCTRACLGRPAGRCVRGRRAISNPSDQRVSPPRSTSKRTGLPQPWSCSWWSIRYELAWYNYSTAGRFEATRLL